MEQDRKQHTDLLELLELRYSYFDIASRFDKCVSCEYTCCSCPLSVDLTFSDIYSIAYLTGLSCREVFHRYLQIGITPYSLSRPISVPSTTRVKLSIELKAGCPFHTDNSCSLYCHPDVDYLTGRPLACALFPEVLALPQKFDLRSDVSATFLNYKHSFSSLFPCICNNSLSKERAQIILSLKNLFDQEVAVTESLIFGQSPYVYEIDELEIAPSVFVDRFFLRSEPFSREDLRNDKHVTSLIRTKLKAIRPHLFSKLDGFLNDLDTSPEKYAVLLQSLFHTPTLIPIPCHASDLEALHLSISLS